jgi:hypothetical protein
MNFIQKLTQDTLNGNWDFHWKYVDGTKTYTFNVPKHYLSGMNFSLEKDSDMVILPNGYGLIYDKNALKALRDAVDVSLENTADKSIEMYLSGETMTEEQQTSEEEADIETKTEQPVKEKSNEKAVNKLNRNVGVTTRPDPTTKSPTKR